MLVVRDCERFSDEEIAQLAEYAGKASKRSCLVLCANKVDGRKAGWKKLRSAACEVAFAPLYRNQMADWIVRQAKLKKLAISAEAADYLAEAVGTDMALADVALQKLALAESAEISLETAKMLVADTRERSVFELTDAISVRDTGTALKALRNMLEHGAECLAIAFMLARHVRLLLKVKSGLDNGLSENALASYVGVSSYFLRDYLKAAQHFESSELEHIHAKLFEADRLLKGSRRPAALVIESVILEFCQLKPASMR
jgi:DNA polymerase-3 subunit delta